MRRTANDEARRLDLPRSVQKIFTGRRKGEDIHWKRKHGYTAGTHLAVCLRHARRSVGLRHKASEAESAFFRDVRYYPPEGP